MDGKDEKRTCYLSNFAAFWHHARKGFMPSEVSAAYLLNFVYSVGLLDITVFVNVPFLVQMNNVGVLLDVAP